MENSPDGMTVESVIKSFKECSGRDLEGDELNYIVERLMAEAKEAMEEKEPRSGTTKRVFGTSFSKHLASLNGDETCLLLADHDPIRAREIYQTADVRIVIAAVKAKTSLLAELAGVWYEAVMFGMGGYYKGEGPNDKVIDLSDDSTKAYSELRRLGLM